MRFFNRQPQAVAGSKPVRTMSKRCAVSDLSFVSLDLYTQPKSVRAQVKPPEAQHTCLTLLGCMAMLVGEVGAIVACPLGDEDEPRGKGDTAL